MIYDLYKLLCRDLQCYCIDLVWDMVLVCEKGIVLVFRVNIIWIFGNCLDQCICIIVWEDFDKLDMIFDNLIIELDGCCLELVGMMEVFVYDCNDWFLQLMFGFLFIILLLVKYLINNVFLFCGECNLYDSMMNWIWEFVELVQQIDLLFVVLCFNFLKESIFVCGQCCCFFCWIGWIDQGWKGIINCVVYL